ncbi:MAG: DNA integrity scanning diadenylate cyclase DisA [Desulfobacteraceae bacterium]|jgi:diadenylate cyclase
MIAAELIPKIKLVAPGTLLRQALDEILMARFGALIVFLDDIKQQEKILEGGFYIGASFSPEKVYELAKMDGAIILDESVSRILAANVQLTPDPSLPTNETGMRHRAAERMARQTGKFVLSISRRRSVITLYYRHFKHQLNDIAYLITRIGQTIYTVEHYKENLGKLVTRLNADEFENRVLLAQVIELVSRCLEILSLLDEINPYVVETGIEGRLPAMRLNAANEEIDTLLSLLAEDYCAVTCSEQETHRIVETLRAIVPPDDQKISDALGWPMPDGIDLYDVSAQPRGLRMLKQIAKIPAAAACKVVNRFKYLSVLTQADAAALMEVEGVGEKRARSIIEAIQYLQSRRMHP